MFSCAFHVNLSYELFLAQKTSVYINFEEKSILDTSFDLNETHMLHQVGCAISIIFIGLCGM